MRLRSKLMLITAAASVVPVLAATLVGRGMVERSWRDVFVRQLSDGEQEVRDEFRALKAEVSEAVAQLCKGDEDHFTRRVLISLAKGGPDDETVRRLNDETPRVMRERGLDTLLVVGPDQRVLAAGHFPGLIGDTAPRVRAGKQAMLLPERVIERQRPTTRLTVQVWGVARHSLGTRVKVMGGRFLDEGFIKRLRFGSTAELGGATGVLLQDARGRRLAGSRNWERGGYAAFPKRVVRLYDPEGREAARVSLAVSDAQLRTTLRVINYVALALVGGGLMLSVLLGGVARRISRPLEELAAGAEAVAAGDLERQIPVRSRDEVGDLVATFNRMTGQLKDSHERLAAAERVAAWRSIAQRIAHEIKNPLFPIQTSIETLRKVHRKRHPKFEEIFDESTGTILEEVARLKRIVSEFSSFARMPKPRLAACDLAELVRSTAAMIATEDLAVDAELPPALPPVMADREQLTQVLLNLLQNAQEALGGHPEPRIAVRLQRVEGEVELRVTDNGPGFDEETATKLFTPYFTKGKVGGTGLGMAIVHRIITDHGGAIEARNAEGGGAEVIIRLAVAVDGELALASS